MPRIIYGDLKKCFFCKMWSPWLKLFFKSLKETRWYFGILYRVIEIFKGISRLQNFMRKLPTLLWSIIQNRRKRATLFAMTICLLQFRGLGFWFFVTGLWFLITKWPNSLLPVFWSYTLHTPLEFLRSDPLWIFIYSEMLIILCIKSTKLVSMRSGLK